MKIRHAVAMLAAGAVLGGLTGLTRADAQSADPIQTVDGYPGCGGNSKIQDVPPEGITCANKRTYHFGRQTRTVTAVTHIAFDGSASSTYTLDQAVGFVVPLRVRSHAGISSDPGPLTDDVTGEIPAGTVGPVTLYYRVVCGQIDVKAVLTGEGQEAGRISGGYFCIAPTSTTTPSSVPGSVGTVPDNAPSTIGSSVSQVTVRPGQALPATGNHPAAVAAAATLLAIAGLVLIARAQREEQPAD